MSLNLNIEGIKKFLNWEEESKKILPKIKDIYQNITQNEELKNKYLGWIDSCNYDIKDIERLKKLKTQSNLDVLVVIGIGGSYLGAKAGIEFLHNPFSHSKPEIIFAGHQVSGNYLNHLIHYLKDKKWAINVISKSGTTLEPALTFRILQKEIQKRYGEQQARKFIFVTTDSKKGILLKLAIAKNYERFVIPDSVGGRFSVFTNVGFLPFVFANLDVEMILKGACQAHQDFYTDDFYKNESFQYAVVRYLLYTKLDKKIELLVTYEPNLIFFSEWWKQLFAESEGKNNKGIFVSSVNNSTDLHSLGQFIQEGSKIIFETILNVNVVKGDCVVPKIENELDGLNYISGKSFSEINKIIKEASKEAHIAGGVPNLEISIECLDEYHLGYLMYFFKISCVIYCYLLDLNPFDQPGVETYKQRMFTLLKS